MPTEPEFFDLKYLNDLRDLFDDEFGDFAEKHLEDATRVLSEIEDAITKEDFEIIKRHAHRLKSSWRQFGALELGSLYRDFEFWGRESNPADIKANIGALRTEKTKACEQLRTYC